MTAWANSIMGAHDTHISITNPPDMIQTNTPGPHAGGLMDPAIKNPTTRFNL